MRVSGASGIGQRNVCADGYIISSAGSVKYCAVPSGLVISETKIEEDETGYAAVLDAVGDDEFAVAVQKTAIRAIQRCWESLSNEQRGRQSLRDLAYFLVDSGRTCLRSDQKTTIALVVFRGIEYFSLNIGDSPIFSVLDQKVIELSTRDNMYYYNRACGHIYRESQKAFLTDDLSGNKLLCPGHISRGALQVNECLVLCSDAVADTLERMRNFEDAEELVKSALESSSDNCTAVVISAEELYETKMRRKCVSITDMLNGLTAKS